MDSHFIVLSTWPNRTRIATILKYIFCYPEDFKAVDQNIPHHQIAGDVYIHVEFRGTQLNGHLMLGR